MKMNKNGRNEILEYANRAPDVKTIIHWYDLPERIIIKLEPEFQKHLLERAKNNTPKGLKKEIAEIIGVCRHQIKLYFQFKSNFSVRSLKRIMQLAKVSPKEIEKNILANLWKAKDDRISAGWNIPITNKREIGILYHNIGLPLKEKVKKVKRVLDSYKDSLLKIKTFKSTYRILQKLQKRDGCIYRKELIKKFNCKWADAKASWHLNKMMNEGFVKRIAPSKYILVEKSSR